MEKFRKKADNTDAEETMFFRAAQSGASTDRYDTQNLNAADIRRQAGRQNNGYGMEEGEIYTGANGYPPQGYQGQGYSGQAYGSSSNYGGSPVQGQMPRQQSSYGYSSQPQQPRRQPVSRPQQGQPMRQPGRQSQPRPYQGQSGQRPVSQRPYSGRQPQQRPSQQAPQQRRQAPPRQGQQPVNQAPRKQTPSRNAHHRSGRKHSFLGRLIRGILAVVIALFLLYSAIAAVGIFSMNRVATGERSVTNGALDESYVKNVLVIGTDTRDVEEERGRSDSMILVSMNSRTNEIYMTSFMRDVYVTIPGHGSGKLNAAFSYGGPELLMDTLEQNYDISIDDYVMITFAACAGMIDAVGGVELDISDREAEAINEILISEVNEIMGDDRMDDLLEKGGKLKLNGKQALSYSRIRYVGNADFERTQRQRTVMAQVMDKAKKNPLYLAAICMKALPKMTTNLSALSLYGYAVTTPIKLIGYDIQQQRIPEDGTFSGANIDGESVLQVDFAAARQQLQSTVFAE